MTVSQDRPPEPSASLPPGCGLWSGWFLACLVGGALGWYAGWLASLMAPNWPATLLIGAIMGAATGGFQAAVLRLNGHPGSVWLLATAAGWAAGFSGGVRIAQSFGLDGIPFGLATGGSVGLSVGILQWIILRKWASAAAWWVPASVFAWSSALLYYQPGASALGILYGAVAGMVTGTLLLWLLHRPTD